MKVLDLQCRQHHVFEGWFGSEDDFQSQRSRGLVQCPLCEDDQIEKRLSAPRLNLGARETSAASPQSTPSDNAPALQNTPSVPAMPPEMQAAWLALSRKLVAQTEDVGQRFAQEARRMHHGEVQERAIRGQASLRETQELLDEGIAVLPLALPVGADETLQ